MKEKFKEIHKKAIENDWSAEQLEAALKEAGMTAEDVPGMQEMDLDQMASVAGGEGKADPATCKHSLLIRTANYQYSTGPDGGYHVKRLGYNFKCYDCGQQWTGTSDKFNYIQGWKGSVVKMS